MGYVTGESCPLFYRPEIGLSDEELEPEKFLRNLVWTE